MLLLHLSDLHFGNKNRFASDQPANLGRAFHRALVAACKERALPNSLSVALIIVTGDLAESGLPSEFRVAREFFASLAKETGLARSRFVFLPGNHDICWADCRSVRNAKDGEKFPANEFEFRLNSEKLANYRSFLADFYGAPVNEQSLAGLENAHPLGNDGWVRDFPELKLSVAALNTSERENDAQKGGFLSPQQAQALMTYWRQESATTRIKVLALHHNPVSTTAGNRDCTLDWLRAKEKASGVVVPMSVDVFEHYVADIAGFFGSEHLPKLVEDTCAHLVLHGHHHDQGKPNSWHWKTDGNAPVLSVGSFGLVEGQLPGGAPLSCQLIRFVLPPEPKSPRLIAIPLVFDGRFRLEGDVLEGAFHPEAASRAAYDQPLPLPKGWETAPEAPPPPVPATAEFLRDHEHLSYDREPVPTRSFEELEQDMLMELLAKPLSQDLNFDLKRMKDGSGPTMQEKLENLGCLYRGRPTRGALLCFAPTQLLADKSGCCQLQMAIHDASERGGEKAPISLAKGNLLLLYNRGMSWLTSGTVLRRSGRIGSGSRDDLEIPEIVLREALANALVHRDYQTELLQDQPTRIDVYPDKIEITSYGVLLSEVPLELLNSPDQRLRPFRRNPVIAGIFQCMTLVELNASGVQRMRRLMTEAGLALPLFRTSENYVCVTLARPFEATRSAAPIVTGAKTVQPARKAFISSTGDLREHRAAARDACLRAGVMPIMFEEFQAIAEGVVPALARYIGEADVFICILGHRYGSIPANQDVSFIELEFNRARELGKTILVFTMHRDHPLTAEAVQSDQEGRERLMRFKERISNRGFFSEFKSPEDLRNLLEQALTSLPPVQLDAKLESHRADISRIDKYAPAELIGREEELKLLNDAWTKTQNRERGRPNILTFVALGGEGKTSLVAKWAAELASQDWPGCDAAFAWSFYSQGTREQQAASSDLFLKEALLFFGDDTDKEFATSPAGAYEKGQRLARIIGQRRNLLILDGLEPLQYAPTSPTPGELKDQGIAALLKSLAANSRGLCLVTSRYSMPDLRAYWRTTAPEKNLLRLSREAGVHLLKTLGVKGTAKEYESLVEDVKGHALTLQIMGGFLKRAFGGDIRQRDKVKIERADERIDGGHLFRVIAAYEKWMENGSDEAKRQLAILRLMGLFDRPAKIGRLQALLAAPAIIELTEPLVNVAQDDWQFSLNALETANLLTVNRDASNALISLDTHPHIREFFSRQLRGKHLDAWRAAHQRLYEHLCTNTPDKPQPSLEDLQPLYQAVAHACQAGSALYACDKIYRERILRGAASYSVRKLGAFESDLQAIACFFDEPWTRVSPDLPESNQAWLLNQAAVRLRALGRQTEALGPMRAALKMRVEQAVWDEAAKYAGNLSELELTLGETFQAVRDAEQAVHYADRSGNVSQRIGKRTNHADALHQMGRRREAEARFYEAEKMQAEREPNCPLLFSTGGFHFCDLLLMEAERLAWRQILYPNDSTPSGGSPATSNYRHVSQRATRTLEHTEDFAISAPLLDWPLDHLTLGRAALTVAILERSDLGPLASDLSHIGTAVTGLRRAGQQQYLPHGLLARALMRSLLCAKTGPESAQSDLDEAWEIAERGPMKLFMADIHLHRARLFFREPQYPWNQNPDGTPRGPVDDLAAAEKLINDCGYHRRDEELADAKRAILGK